MGPEPDEKCRGDHNQRRAIVEVAGSEGFATVERQKNGGCRKKNAD
jgi:hypothetical protein